MSNNIADLLRPHIQSIKPYSSARDEYTGKSGVFLDANENPYGPVTGKGYNRYPDPYQRSIKEKLSGIKQVATDHIFLGNGSDEPIDLLIRAFCEPGQDQILIMPPTYGMYRVSADINNVACIEVPLTPDFQINSDAVFEAITPNTKIIFICSPNNPSGNVMAENTIMKILKAFNGLVVIDEAYIDFCALPSWTNKLKDFDNLIVLQTFSKAWGLAALRLGMAFTNPFIIGILNKIKPPYNINGATQELALEALGKEIIKEKMVEDILEERKYLREALSAIPQISTIYPSEANFLLVRIADAHHLYQKLIDELIIVRDRSKVLLCDDCLRITVGTKKENELLVTTLIKLLN